MMSNPLLTRIGIAALAITMAGACLQAQVGRINLLKNSGFEAGGDTPAEWKIVPSAEWPRISRDSTQAREGRSSLKWESNDTQSAYKLISQKLPISAGRKYELSAWIKTENVKGVQATGASICFEYEDAQGKHIKGGAFPAGVKDTHDWQQIVAYTGPIPAEAVAGGFTCYVRKSDKPGEKGQIFTGQAWWDDVCLRPVSFFASMLRPAQKRLITDSDPVVEFDLECWPGDFRLTFAQTMVEFQVIDEDKQVVASESFDVTGRQQQVSFDLVDLKPGQYTIASVFRVKETEQELWRWEHAVQRAPANVTEPRVYIDKFGRLIRNGKPMFPLGAYVRNAPVKQVKDLGFNCMMSYDALSRKQMDEAHAQGLAVIYSLKDYFNSIWYCRGGIRNIDDEVPALLKEMAKHRDHPALIAWYVNDELGPACLPQLRAHYEAINKADPDHPTWSVHYKTEEMTQISDSCDILGVDVYPVPNNPVWRIGESTREVLDATFRTRPIWYVPQMCDLTIYGEKNARAPTLAEMRCMSWQAICEGATGLIYYSLPSIDKDPTSPEKLRADSAQMVGEIASYTDTLLSVEPCPTVRVSGGKWLRWTARRVGDKVYIFALSDGQAAGKANFSIDAKIKGASVIDLGVADAADCKVSADGSWSDTIDLMHVKVYTVTIE